MGNVNISPASCFQPCSSPKSVSLIFWDGTTTALTPSGRRSGKLIAGQIMVNHPDKLVCNSESFFLGHPIPALSIHDELLPGQTYLVLPVDLFACTKVLSASSLAAFTAAAAGSPNNNNKTPLVNGGCQPLQYLKGSDGGVLIKVAPEFMIRLLVKVGRGEGDENGDGSNGFLCSTPELKKHYDQLVGCREQKWSPKVETISEYKVRYSPCRFIGLEWKQKEEQYCS
ncbi:unnamed protein product [Linum tenue]|uniref:Uncharacterized protein n=1 Tax=Linum tenue TaxID=586396 RepID=A0AAV0QAI3_9ROSI|nr:unnamed protein product [Linum tenue]